MSSISFYNVTKRGGFYMINIMCSAPAVVKLSDLKPFQGDLKKRTDKDVKALATSIQTEGLLMPFAVWTTESGDNMLLDGHGRLTALNELATKDAEILEQKFPCIRVTAASEEDARKALLQITSSYGKVTKEGAVKFCATIPTYHAPSINRYVHNTTKKPRKEKQAVNAVIRIAVPLDKEASVRDLLSQVDYIKVLG